MLVMTFNSQQASSKEALKIDHYLAQERVTPSKSNCTAFLIPSEIWQLENVKKVYLSVSPQDLQNMK